MECVGGCEEEMQNVHITTSTVKLVARKKNNEGDEDVKRGNKPKQ